MKKFYLSLCVLCLVAGCKKETKRILSDETSVQQLSEQATQQRGGRPFEITFAGAAEIPGPGDPDG